MARYVLEDGIYDGVRLHCQPNVTADNWTWAELKLQNDTLVHVIFVMHLLEYEAINKYDAGYWDGSGIKIRCIAREEFEKALEEAGV